MPRLILLLILMISPSLYALNIVTSIKPLQLITLALIHPEDQVRYIIPAQASPHTYSIKPSAISQIKTAELVIWVGPDIENHWDKLMTDSQVSLELIHALGLEQSETDQRKKAEEKHKDEHEHDHDHDHDHEKEKATKHEDEHDHEHDHEKEKATKYEDEHDHEHEEEKATKHEDEHDHDHEKEKATKHEDEHDHEHHHEHGQDTHIWISPRLAVPIATAISQRLSQLNPDQASAYQQRLVEFENKLEQTIKEVRQQLLPVQNSKFYTTHDAFGYFTTFFTLSNSGYLTISPSIPLSAKHLNDIRNSLQNDNIACIFGEPQLDPTPVHKLIQGTKTRYGVLDPMASGVPENSNGYFAFLHQLADSFSSCLAGN